MANGNGSSDDPVTLFTVPDPQRPGGDEDLGESLFSDQGREEGRGGEEDGGLFSGLPGEGGGDGEQTLFPEPPEREVEERGPDMPDLNDLPDATGVDRETYFRQPETQRRLREVAQAAQQNPEQYTSEELNVISSLTREASEVLSAQDTGRDATQEDRRPRPETEDLSVAEGAVNSFMRGVNDVQAFFSRVGESAAGAVGLEGASDYFERLAEEQQEDRATYARSEEVAQKQQEINEAQEEQGQIAGIKNEFMEDPVGSFRWLASKTVETAPTLATSVAGSALGAAASGSTSPVWGPIAGAYAAATAIETGAQLSDAAYTEQGLEREPSAEDEAAAWISGAIAGLPEALSAGKIADNALPIGRAVRNVLEKTPFDEATKKAMKSQIGRELREKTADIAARAQTAGRVSGDAVTEGITEGLQSAIADVGASYGWDPDREIGQNWFQESLVGFTLGGGASAVREAGQAAFGEGEPDANALEEAAREVPFSELRQMMNEAEDPEVKRTLGRVLEERFVSEFPDQPSITQESEETSPVQDESSARQRLQEAISSLQEEAETETEEAEQPEAQEQEGRGFGAPLTEETVQDMSVEELAARTRTATASEQQMIAQELTRRRQDETEEGGVDFDEEARTDGPIEGEELRATSSEQLADRAEQSDSQEETDQILAELMRRAQEEEAPEQVVERNRQSQRLGELTGRRVEVNAPWGEAQGTLTRDSEGNFVASIPQEQVPDEYQSATGRSTVIEVEGARQGELGSTAREAGVRVFPEPDVSFDPEGSRIEVEEEGEVTTYEDIEINENDAGEAVSLTYQTPQGGQRTTRRPEVVQRAALEQTLAERGVEPEPAAADVADEVEAEEVGVEEEEVDVEREEVAVEEEAQEEAAPADEGAQEAEVEGAPATDVSNETLRENLSEVERETLTDREQTALQGALLSGLSDVEDTLDAAYEGERVGENVTEADLERAENWVIETFNRVDEFMEGNISEGARQVAERLKNNVLAGIDQDLTRMRQELLTRPDRTEPSTQQDTDQQDATQPSPPSVSTEPTDRPAPPDAGAAAGQAAEGDQDVDGPTTQPRGRRARAGQPGDLNVSLRDEVARRRRQRGQPFQREPVGQEPGQEAAGPDISESVGILEAAVRERGFSPQIIDVGRQELQNPETEINTPDDVRRALSIAESLREVTDAPTVRPQEVREAFNVVNEGGLRQAARAAEDADIAQRYNEALEAMERSAEPQERQASLLEDLEEAPESPEAQRVQGEIDEVESELEEVQREIEERRRELARAYEEQFEQLSGFEDAQAEEVVQVEITEEGFQRGSGPGGFVTPDDVRDAQESLERLIGRRDRLQQRLIRLEREGDQIIEEAEEAQSQIKFEEAVNQQIRNETSTNVTKTDTDGTYSVGFAEAPIRRRSGDQVTFQRQAGQLLVVAPDGTAVSRQSSNHDAAVLSALTDPDGIISEYLSPERSVAYEAGGQENVTPERVANGSQDPFEIAQTWLNTDPSLNAVEEAVGGRRFSPESVVDALERATVSLDQEPNTGYSLWKDAGQSSMDVAEEEVEFADTSNVGAVDEVANILASRLGTTEERVIEQIGNIIARHPGQNENIQTEGRRQRRRLNERFQEVMGFTLGPTEEARAEFANQFIEARQRAELVSRIREAQADRENGADIMEDVVRTMEGRNLALEDLLGDGPLSIGDNLTETQRRALRIAWDEYHVDPDEGLPFMRLEGAVSGMDPDIAFEIIENVATAEASIEGLPDAEVVRSPRDLPDDVEAVFNYHAAQYGGQLVQPAFVRGDTLYVVASHLAAAAEAQNTSLADFTRKALLHEWAHQGMEALWGENYQEVMAGLYDELGEQEVRDVLGSNYDARFRGEITPEDKAFLADEYLAHRAENMVENTDPGIMQRIVLYFKRAWQRLTGTELGDAEIGLMLIGAYEAARGEATAATTRGTKFMMVAPGTLGRSAEEGVFVNPYDGILRQELSDLGAEVQGTLQTIVEEGGRAERVRQERERLQQSGAVPGDVLASLHGEEIDALTQIEIARDELSEGMALEEVFDHPRLYRAYPSLREIPVRYDPDFNEVAGTTYDPVEITFGNEARVEDMDLVESVLLHEIQHQIQAIEGWTAGANYEVAAQIIEQQAEDAGINTDDDAAVMNWAAQEYGGTWQEALYTVYRRVSGEIEARETDRRKQMNALERAVQPPFVRDGELVVPADEAFTQSSIPDQTPTVQSQRAAYDQAEGQGEAPEIRFSRKPGADPNQDAQESVREDLDAGVIDLSDVVPVQTEETPELVGAGRPPVPDAPLPQWAESDAETPDGRDVVEDIRSDPEGEEVGVRSIIQMAVEQIFPEFEVLEASYVESANADFQGVASMLYRRLLSDGDAEAIDWEGWADQIQQIGRGRADETLSHEEIMQEWVRLYIKGPGLVEDLEITRRIEDALDELDPAYLKTLRDAARAWDAHTDRTVEARLRTYNTDRGPQVDSSTIGGTFQRFLTSAVARGHAIDKMHRDLYNVTRAYAEQERGFLGAIAESIPIFGRTFETEGSVEARRVLSDASRENARPRDWHQMTNKVNGEVAIAFSGRGRGRDGFRTFQTDTRLTEEELDLLAESFDLDRQVSWTDEVQVGENEYQAVLREGTLREALEEVGEGQELWWTDRAIKDITSQIEEGEWGRFEEYARRKVDLARAERPAEITVDELPGSRRQDVLAPAIRAELDAQDITGQQRQTIEDAIENYVRGMPDGTGQLLNVLEGVVPIRDVAWLRQQGIDTDVTMFPGAEEMGVPELRQTVAQFESQNPEWEGVFRELETYADMVLLSAVQGGMKEATEAVRMKDAYRAYLPLMRDVEDAGLAGGAGAWPDPSFRQVKGSTTPSKPLLQNFKDRMRQVLDAYYHNASIVSIVNMFERVAADDSAPFPTRELARQTVQEVGRIPRRVADVQPGEIRSMIAEAYGPNVRPQDIEIVSESRPIIRARAPDGQNIIAPLIDGERVFYRVDDPVLLQYMTLSGDEPGGLVQNVADMLADVVQPWKRVLTGNIVFALRNGLARDPAYASFMGLDPETDNGTVIQRAKQVTPLMAQVVGLVERVTGTEVTDESAVGEMFVEAVRHTGSSQHLQRADQNVWQQAKSVLAEGIMQDDWASLAMGEKLSRLPGIVMNVLMKPLELFLWGTGQRQFSVAMEENTRLGAFKMAREVGQTPLQAQSAYDRIAGNFGETPANSTIHSIYRQAGFANPALQATYEMFRGVFSYDPKVRRVVLGSRIAAVAGMTATAWAINQMLTPDDRQEELDERTDEEKMTTFPLLGTYRVPFDYGFVGTIQALTYNLLERQAGRGVRSKSAIADRIARSAYDIPLLQTSGLINPQIQTIREWQANYNFFWGEEIVPSTLQYQPPSEQAFSDTPGAYKWLGKQIGASPLKIQHAVSNGFSYQTDQFMQFVSDVRRGETESTQLINWGPDNPIISRLWQRDPIGWRSQSVQTVSNRAREFDAAERQLRNIKENLTARPSPGLQKRMQELQTRMRRLQPFKRRMQRIRNVWQRADQLQSEGEFERAKEAEREMTDIARTFLQEREQEQ